MAERDTMEARNARRILVTGAIGLQGGAAASHLVSYGHHVRILDGDPERAKGPGDPNLEVVHHERGDREGLKRALDGMEGVFLITPSDEDPEKEFSHGKAWIDACAEQRIDHIVYSSVCGANKKTGVPHFESKHRVEEHLKESGISWTILRPVWFMEHFGSWYRPSIEKGVLSTPIRADRHLRMVSVDDVGRVAAEAFTKPMKFVGRELDIAGDKLTMTEIAEEISRVLSHSVRYEQIPGDRAENAVGHDWAVMFRWLDEHGYDADIWVAQQQFQRFQISMTSFRDYVEQSRLGLGKAA